MGKSPCDWRQKIPDRRMAGADGIFRVVVIVVLGDMFSALSESLATQWVVMVKVAGWQSRVTVAVSPGGEEHLFIRTVPSKLVLE